MGKDHSTGGAWQGLLVAQVLWYQGWWGLVGAAGGTGTLEVPGRGVEDSYLGAEKALSLGDVIVLISPPSVTLPVSQFTAHQSRQRALLERHVLSEVHFRVCVSVKKISRLLCWQHLVSGCRVLIASLEIDGYSLGWP